MARGWAAVLCLPALLLAAACANEPASGAAAPVRPMADVSRGGLLYGNTCAACHNEQTHWREDSVVHTWLWQVTRWQEIAGQSGALGTSRTSPPI